MAIVERQLGAHDRADAQRLCRLGQLHRAVQAVVVDHPDRLVALVGRRGRELDRMGRPVQEREGRVAVELYVGHRLQERCSNQPPPWRSWNTTTLRPSTRTSSK